MTWHLKDRTLEKAFEEYSGGKFVDALNYAVEHKNIDSEFIVYVGFVRKCLGDDSSEICLCFKTDELEDIPEYNPNEWNTYPKVTPPIDVPMLISFDDGYSTKAYFNGVMWIETYQDSPLFSYRQKQRIIFRPWDD